MIWKICCQGVNLHLANHRINKLNYLRCQRILCCSSLLSCQVVMLLFTLCFPLQQPHVKGFGCVWFDGSGCCVCQTLGLLAYNSCWPARTRHKSVRWATGTLLWHREVPVVKIDKRSTSNGQAYSARTFKALFTNIQHHGCHIAVWFRNTSCE